MAAAAAVVFGVVVRLIHFDSTLFADELSTLYIARDHSLSQVLSYVHSDAEISPPLYFVLSWAALKLGSTAELVRLPALIAGIATIPLAYLLARRLFGGSAGLIAASLMALNPFMVFYAADGRAYTLAIACLLASTLVMLIAADHGGAGWWAGYAVLVAAAMHAHYTCAFVLGAQFLWLLWARPKARLAVLIATGAAVVLYLPWASGAIADSRSSTVDILSSLQGDGIAAKLQGIGIWSFGYEYNTTDRIPGQIPLVIGIIALGALAAGAIVKLLPSMRAGAEGESRDRLENLSLALVIAVATPLAEVLILLAGGTDLFGSRNLATATGGFAVLISGLAMTSAPTLAAASVAALLGVFALGTVKTLDKSYGTPDFRAAAMFINANAALGDAVLDTASGQFSPVPTTPVGAHLSDSHPLFTLYQPPGEPPLLKPCPARRPIVTRALESSRGHRLFVIGAPSTVTEQPHGIALTLQAGGPCIINGQAEFQQEVVKLPGAQIEQMRGFDGFGTVEVFVLRSAGAG